MITTVWVLFIHLSHLKYSGKLYDLSVSLMIVGKHIAILLKKANFPVLHALYSAV